MNLESMQNNYDIANEVVDLIVRQSKSAIGPFLSFNIIQTAMNHYGIYQDDDPYDFILVNIVDILSSHNFIILNDKNYTQISKIVKRWGEEKGFLE